MNPAIVGQKLKKIYPQYSEASDEQLGLKFITKYGDNPEVMSALGIEVTGDPKKELEDVKAQAELGRIKSGEIPAGATENEKKKLGARSDAERVLNQLEDAYLGANEGQGLAYGRLEGAKQKIAALAGQNAQLSTYDGLRESLRPMFARAAGDVGNLSEKEQQAAVKNLPTGLSTPEEAILFFEGMRGKFGLPERDLREEYPTFASQIDEDTLKTIQPQMGSVLSGKKKEVSLPKQKEVKVLQQTPQQPQQQEGDILSQILSQAGSTLGPQGVNALDVPVIGDALFGRAKDLRGKLKGGQQVSPDDFLGAGGEYARNVGYGVGGFLPMLLGGAASGATTPGASVDERLQSGATEGALGGLLGGSGKLLPKIIHPRSTAATAKAQAAAEATTKNIKFSITKDMQDAAKYILDKKDFLEPTQKNILNLLAKGKELTPKMVNKVQPILREAGRTLTNNPLRSSEGQAFDFLYNQTLQQSKELVPKMFKATQDIAKTFPKPARELEPLQRFLSKIGGRGLDVGIGAGVGAGAFGLLNLLGIGNRD
jgi:hypothetical protein